MAAGGPSTPPHRKAAAQGEGPVVDLASPVASSPIGKLFQKHHEAAAAKAVRPPASSSAAHPAAVRKLPLGASTARSTCTSNPLAGGAASAAAVAPAKPSVGGARAGMQTAVAAKAQAARPRPSSAGKAGARAVSATVAVLAAQRPGHAASVRYSCLVRMAQLLAAGLRVALKPPTGCEYTRACTYRLQQQRRPKCR